MTNTENNNAVLKFYANYFKGWRERDMGVKPTADQLTSMHRLGLRPGKQALACAMSLRAGGVTGAQIVMACGAPQLNRMRGLITDGLFKREAATPDARNHMVYFNSITPKGQKRIDRAASNEVAAEANGNVTDAAEPAKPTKAATSNKRISKARKGTSGKKPSLPVVTVPPGEGDLQQCVAATITEVASQPPVDVQTGEPEVTANG